MNHSPGLESFLNWDEPLELEDSSVFRKGTCNGLAARDSTGAQVDCEVAEASSPWHSWEDGH